MNPVSKTSTIPIAISFILAAVSGFGFSPSSENFEFRKTTFPEFYQLDSRRLEVQGTSLLKYKRIFKLYTGALYLDTSETGPLEQRAKRFEVVYLRTLNGMDLVQAGAQNLSGKYGADRLEQLRSRFDKMNAWWEREFQKGDRAAISYIPGKGTALEINGELLGWVEGEDFAEVYFSIWLGPGEVCERFKEGLLTANP